MTSSSLSDDSFGGGSFDELLARIAAAPAVEGAWSRRTLPPGTLVGGRYRVEGVLGRGGTAVVYRARSLELRRVVAIKILSLGADRERLRRLHAEASTMARLSHPHVLAVMDVGTHDGQLFLVVEHVEGGTLRDWLGARPRSLAAIVDAFVQAGEGLAAAHRIGVVHRDFKPDNALVGRDGRVRVSDFGLARGLELASEGPSQSGGEDPPEISGPFTATGLVHGTPAYMAPEQLDGHGADERSDQFAFCVALWEALHGQRPFAARTLDELRERVREGHVASPQRGRVPRGIKRVLLRGLRPAPEDRFPSMDALLQALRGAGKRRVSLAAVALLAAVGGLGFASLDRAPSGPDCDASRLAPDLAGVWDDTTRDEAARAFEATRAAAAPAAWSRARGTLDAYAESWVLARQHACAAVAADSETRDGDLDLKMACLRRRRDHLAAVTAVLVRADDAVVVNTVDLVARLAPVSDCADIEALKRDPVPPADPRIAAQVEGLRARLAVAMANADAGRFPGGIAIAEEVADVARGLGYAPLLADALLVYGTTASKQGRHEQANDALREAYFAATSIAYDRAALRAALALTARAGRSGADLEEALRWHEIGTALAQRTGSGPHVQAELEGARAEAYYIRARGPEAIEGFQRALALLEEHEPKGSLVVPVRTTLANVLMLERRFAECVDVAAASVDVATELYGEVHASTAMALGTLAQCRAYAGDAAAAEAPARQAVEILEAAQGRNSLNVADAYDALQTVLTMQGKIDAAIEANARVREIQDAVNPGDTYNVAAALGDLGLLEAQRGRTTEAKEALERAIAIAGDDNPALAELREGFMQALAQLRDAEAGAPG